MRPAVVMHTVYCLERGGAQRVIADLARGLDAARFRVEVCALWTSGPVGDELVARGIPVHVLGKRPGIDPGAPLRLRRLLAARQVDLLHAHGFSGNTWALPASLGGGVRARILTAHTAPTDRVRPPRWAERLVHAATQHLVALSEAERAELLARGYLRPERVHLIRNGVDLGRLGSEASARSARAALGLAEASPLLVHVGRLVPVKGQRDLLQAVALLRPHWPALRLLLVGDGPLRAAVEKEAAALGISDVVYFAGNRSDAPLLARAGDLFVLPSLSEGLPVSLLEAMACARPVVATAVGGIPDVVEDGVTGLLVPPRNPQALARTIARLAGSPGWAATLGAAARRRVLSRHSWEAMVAQHAALYDLALARTGVATASRRGSPEPERC